MTSMRLASSVTAIILCSLAGCSRAGSDPDDVPDSVVVENLRDAGSDVTKPHAVDFNLYVPTEDAATRLEEQLTAQGFEVSVDAGDEDWGITATKKMVPAPDEITKVGDSLRKLAEAEGGEYDGWGAAVVP